MGAGAGLRGQHPRTGQQDARRGVPGRPRLKGTTGRHPRAQPVGIAALFAAFRGALKDRRLNDTPDRRWGEDGGVAERRAAINERVAAAVDAWLAAPRDGNVSQRIVAAIEARRAYLQPPLPDLPPEPD